MAKYICILMIMCLSLMLKMGMELYAETAGNEASAMQDHIEEVKLSNPEEYKAMLERAGGTITDCCSCHKVLCQKQSS